MDDDIAGAEARIGRLPESYRTFLAIAGRQTNDDNNGMLFWAPADLRAATEVLTEAVCDTPFHESAVVIADHMQESWYYVLWTSGDDRGGVSLVLGGDAGDPFPPMAPLSAFLTAYLENSASMYPP